MKAVLVAINAKYIHSNLAVYSLFENAGANKEYVDLVQYTINNQMDVVVRDLYTRRPDVLFFSCYIWNIEYVKDIVREIHKLLPKVDIWLGGPEVSYDGQDFLFKYPQIRGVMIGEGEETFKEVLDYYVGKCCKDMDAGLSGGLDDIPGIMFCQGEEIVTTKNRKLMELGDVKFVYDNLEEFDNKIIYYESSRGCPFGCSYCMSSIDKSVRFRETSLVFRELLFFLNSRVSQVKFIDRTFNVNVARTMEILQFLKEHDNGVTNFHFEVAADIITDEEIELLSGLRPGYVQLEIGVQSTNPVTIKEIDRRMDFNKVADVAARLIGADNIHIHLDLIAGLPFENLASFKKSFNDVYSLRPHELQLGFLKVLKGAKMHEKAAEYGIVYGDKAPYEVLSTKWLSFDDVILLKEVEEMLEVYYNSGLFVNTIKLLEKCFESPFAMYQALADFYKERGLLWINHTRITRYTLLLEFMEQVVGAPIDILKKVLLFDLYSRENLKTRPEFAGENDFYRQSNREKYRELAKKYNKKNFHVEPFGIDILKLIYNGQVCEREVLLLFDYDNKHPVRNMAAVEEIVWQ